MKKKRITKNQFLKGFLAITAVLALVRLIFPSVAGEQYSDELLAASDSLVVIEGDSVMDDSVDVNAETVIASCLSVEGDSSTLLPEISDNTKLMDSGDVTEPSDMAGEEPGYLGRLTTFFRADGKPVKNRVGRVASFKEEFPDSNAVQLTAANMFGVTPVDNRSDAESRKSELVYVGGSPFYHIDELNSSIPYLVPRAAVLLHDIGRNFMDSLQVKQVPIHKVMVTSVLRSKEDVVKLRRRNKNATENSCHLYGTTFDISYRRFVAIPSPKGAQHPEIPSQVLRDVLSEVLRDLRLQNRCYVKFEVKQSCFHITVR